VTLDVEMPGMDGLETLRRLVALDDVKRPGVLMISSLTRSGADTTLRALEMGAFDFVAKPGPEMLGAAQSLERTLAMKISGWRHRNMRSRVDKPPFQVLEARPQPKAVLEPGRLADVVLIGVSTGGPRALTEMLPVLSQRINCPILLVQHMPPQFTQSLAQTLDKKCVHTVVEASEGMVVRDRHIYVAPGGFHMVVRRKGLEVEIGLNTQEPENGCRPSVDALFRSAADIFSGHGLVALILTGMGCDGTAGMRLLKKSGAYCIAQDEATSVVWGMPGSVVSAGLADEEAALMDIPEAVARRCAQKGGRL